MQGSGRSVERSIPSEAEALETLHAAIAVAHELAAWLEARSVPAHLALLGTCWLLADVVLTAEVVRGIPAAFTRAIVDRQIGEAIGELRTALLSDPAKIH